jgi:hypothetical protein
MTNGNKCRNGQLQTGSTANPMVHSDKGKRHFWNSVKCRSCSNSGLIQRQRDIIKLQDEMLVDIGQGVDRLHVQVSTFPLYYYLFSDKFAIRQRLLGKKQSNKLDYWMIWRVSSISIIIFILVMLFDHRPCRRHRRCTKQRSSTRQCGKRKGRHMWYVHMRCS